MIPLSQGGAGGIYHGIIEKARYDNGVMWARCWIPSWSAGDRKYITRWARVSIPWGSRNYGTWGAPHVGEHVWVAFEEANPERPVVLGYIPMPQGDINPTEMPPEFVNDDYADKSPHTDQRDEKSTENPPINPAWITKSRDWQMYFLLHDKLKRIVLRAADSGGGECENKPGEPKPAIELGELAKHNVLLGDLFMNLYNDHRHRYECAELGVQETSPPRGKDCINCEEHLSHVVYVIRDPWDQPPSEQTLRMVQVGRELMSAGDAAKNIADFCEDPAGFVCSTACRAGVPESVVEAGAENIRGCCGLVNGALNAANKLASSVGMELPDVEGIGEIIAAVSQGDIGAALGETAKNVLPMALATVGIPPVVTKGVLDIAESVMAGEDPLKATIGAAGKAFGADGLVAAAALCAGALF